MTTPDATLASPSPDIPTQRLEFGMGYAVPPLAPCAWGGRAVYTGGFLEIVWNRQAKMGDEVQFARLAKYLDEVALPGARKAARHLYDTGGINNPQDATILFQDALVTLVGDTRRSYGYMYMAAWFGAGALPNGSPVEAYTSPIPLAARPTLPPNHKKPSPRRRQGR